MTLLGIDKVLHLYEYENLPQELVYQKNDDELSSGTLIPAPVTYGQRQIALPIPNLIQGKLWADRPGDRLSVGIGKYGTKKDGVYFWICMTRSRSPVPTVCITVRSLYRRPWKSIFSFWSRKDSEGVKGIPFSTAAVILYSETGLTAAYWAVSRSGRP